MRRAFTLIELLIVIGVLAVLAVAVILTLNPAELLRQSRDTRRVAEIKALNAGINGFSSGNPKASLGTSSLLYVSLPDSDPACGSWALPPLPGPWEYRCAPETSYRNLDGTGWIPLNVANLAKYVSVSALPVDPVNDATRFYAYATASSTWEVSAFLESRRLGAGGSGDLAGRDGGDSATRYEQGRALDLQP